MYKNFCKLLLKAPLFSVPRRYFPVFRFATQEQNFVKSLITPQKIAPEDEIPLPLQQRIHKSTYISSVLTIFEENRDVFNENNVIFVVTRVSKLLSHFNEDPKPLAESKSMSDFMSSLRIYLKSMNGEAVAQTLILLRKLKDRRFLNELLKKQDFDNVLARFRELCDEKNVMFNQACLMFYEAVYVRIPTESIFDYINEALRNHILLIPHLDSYYVTLLLRSLTTAKDLRKPEIFWKNLLETLNALTKKEKDVNILVRFFSSLIELESQENLSKNLEILSILLETCENLLRIFETNKDILLDYDVLNICRAYRIAPEWLPRDFLRKIQRRAIQIFESHESLDFRLRFLEVCANSQENDRLSEENSDKLLISVKEYVQTREVPQVYSLYLISKVIVLYKSAAARELSAILVKTLNNLELNDQNNHFFLLITKKLLDSGEKSQDFYAFFKKVREFSLRKLKLNVSRRPVFERLGVLWEVTFHEEVQENAEVSAFCDEFLKALMATLQISRGNYLQFIDFFGDKLKNSKVFPEKLSGFKTELRNIAEKLPKLSPLKTDLIDDIKLELFFNSTMNTPDALKFSSKDGKFFGVTLGNEEISMVLRFFRAKPVKTKENLDVLMRLLWRADPKTLSRSANEILSLVLELPWELCKENVRKLISFLDFVLERAAPLGAQKIPYQMLLDIDHFLQKLGILRFNRHRVLLAREVLRSSLISEFSLLKLSEIAMIIAMGLERTQKSVGNERYATMIDALRKISDKEEGEILKYIDENDDDLNENENLEGNQQQTPKENPENSSQEPSPEEKTEKTSEIPENSLKKRQLECYKNQRLLCRFVKVHYKAYMLDLKKKDPIFLGHAMEQVTISF